jgi:hypothetical protein
MRGIGFDATYDGEADEVTKHSRVRFVRTRFDAYAGGAVGDLVCCRHVLEHVDNPVAFLRGMRSGMRPDTLLYLEVPNAAFVFTESGLWDLIYQHCIYFTDHALAAAVRAAGFDLLRQRMVFDDQFLAIEAVATDRHDERRKTEPLPHASALVDRFADAAARFTRVIGRWREQLSAWHSAGTRVAMWGAGTKGVTFLNFVAPHEEVGVVVDVNPRKHGRHLAGTGHRVDPPTVLRDYRPDVVIVANRAYEAEIGAALVELGLDASTVAL